MNDTDWSRTNSTRILLHYFVFDSTSYFKFILKYYPIYTLNCIYNSIVQYTFFANRMQLIQNEPLYKIACKKQNWVERNWTIFPGQLEYLHHV